MTTRCARFGLAAVATALLLSLALTLGDWAFGQRRLSLHESRLQRALEQQPTLGALAQGLAAEPAIVELATGDAARELERLTAGKPEELRAALLARAREAPAVRLFRVEDDLLYVAFGDVESRFTGFAIVELAARSSGAGDQKR
ncbi:MAG: hypothetical protein NDJ94_20695 [Vicinamibacteria bacterium]|nr:hypothetical protein [Vicinamibacteria bacterium]